MEASPVLVDSSYYIRSLRLGRDPLRSLALIAAMRDVAVCGIIRCEVGRGIRHSQALRRFHSAWDCMIDVPMDGRLWDDVESTAWKLDRTGKILPLTDLIIACCARRIDAAVLTFDEHFKQVPGIRVVDRLEA